MVILFRDPLLSSDEIPIEAPPYVPPNDPLHVPPHDPPHFSSSDDDSTDDPPADPLAVRHVHIRIHRPDDTFYYFMMRRTVQLDKLVTVYCEKANMQETDVRLEFNGRTLTVHDTPLSLGMENNDLVEAIHLN